MKKTGAIILAAGLSSRMEEFKPMLPLGKTSVILRIIDTIKAAGADPIVAVTGYKGDILEKHISHEGVIFVRNKRYAQTQMFDSVKLGMSRIRGLCDRILLLPADVPLFKAESVELLLEQEDAKVACPVYKNISGHPLLLSAGLIPYILEYDGEGGLRKAIEGLECEVRYVEVDDEGILLDINTPHDYTKLLRRESKINGSVGLRFNIKLRIAREEIFFGPGVAQFLELTDKTGSMQTACTCMHLSYSKGWNMINLAEKQLGYKIAYACIRGVDGGGSSLTEKGREALDAYLKFQSETKKAAERLFDKHFGYTLK